MRVCYIGISSPDFSRNAVYRKALRAAGVSVVDCFDQRPGLGKLFSLYNRFKAIEEGVSVIFVAYPGHALVPLVRLWTRKPIVFDALASMYEAEIISRRPHARFSFTALKFWCMDFLASHAASRILVETNAQADFFQKQFWVQKKKLQRVFTGVDEDRFNPEVPKTRGDSFFVLFRGRFLPEAGVTHILDAAKILEKEAIKFYLVGFGFLLDEVMRKVKSLGLTNVAVESDRKSDADVPRLMARASVSLGQFASHERLSRTIPHKAFESVALKIPYITARAKGIQELFEDEKHVLMTDPGSASDLAEKILWLKQNPEEGVALAEAAYKRYVEVAGRAALSNQLQATIQELSKKD